jgi:hypothetical protein
MWYGSRAVPREICMVASPTSLATEAGQLFGSGIARAVVVRFEVDAAGNLTARAIDPLTRRATPVRDAPELLVVLGRCAAR